MKNLQVLALSKKNSPHFIRILVIVLGFVTLIITSVYGRELYQERQHFISQQKTLEENKKNLTVQLETTTIDLASASAELAKLKAEDQFVRNEKLEEEIKNIQTTFRQAMTTYEEILDLRGDGAKVQNLESAFSLIISQLSKRNYSEAAQTLAKLRTDVAALKTQLASTGGAIPADLKTSNAPPGSGYSRQVVESDAGQFVVDILAADLNSARVQVETASTGDCKDGCPLAALADFVSRSGGFAGINGPYFCPAEYPSCAGKTNSFDTLIMNKSKFYFNSDNNVHSTVPALIFSGSGARLSNSSEAGRDGGVDAVIASQPALIRGGEVAFGGDGDPKKGSRGSRSFIAVKDSTVYIGVVRSATVAEVARVMKTLGMQSALNLDSGGSTAFFANGKYVAGPGRQTPFGIILVRK